MNGRLARAVIAFLALPGLVAFLVPLLLLKAGRSEFQSAWGAVPFALGTGLLAACVREFHVAGRGTLAPWAPPEALVVTGFYRRSRNPMYIAVLLILAGWAIGFAAWQVALYAILVGIAFHARIVLHEEPWLARQFGDAWVRYRTRVPRWL